MPRLRAAIASALAGAMRPRRMVHRRMARRTMAIVARSLAAMALACTAARPSAPSRTAEPGLAIAVYAAAGRAPYAVIDDRRWIDLDGDAIELDRVDPRAQLPSLVVEPLAGGSLEVGL